MVSYWAHLSKNYKLTWCFFESLTRFFQRNKLCCLLFWQLCWGLLAINVSWWFKCERNKSKGSWQTHKPSMFRIMPKNGYWKFRKQKNHKLFLHYYFYVFIPLWICYSYCNNSDERKYKTPQLHWYNLSSTTRESIWFPLGDVKEFDLENWIIWAS